MIGKLNGQPLGKFRIHIPEQGPWIVDCATLEGATLSGKVTATIGAVSLVGTIRPGSSGSMIGANEYRVIAGRGGWGKSVKVPGHHNDAGVRRKAVAAEIAALVGETLGAFEVSDPIFGVDFDPREGPASLCLEACALNSTWWVDFAGVTQVGTRPSTVASGDHVHVLDYDPLAKIVTLDLDSLDALAPGMALPTDKRFTDTLVVKSLDIVCDGASLLAFAWCGDSGAGKGSKGARALRAIAKQATGDRIWGAWRYRVLRQAADGRCDLQSVAKETPDALLVPQRVGCGSRIRFKPGQIVLVEFVEGRAHLPRIVAGDDFGAPGYFPERVELGGPGTQSPIAITGSLVQSGGVGTFATFCDAAGVPVYLCYPGTPPIPYTGPVQVSFGMTPANPASLQPLMGAVMTGSKTASAGPP